MLKNDDAYVPFAKYAYVIVPVVVVVAVVVVVVVLLLEMCCVRYNTTISTRDKRRSIRKHLWVFNITQSIHCWDIPEAEVEAAAAAAAAAAPNIVLILSLIRSVLFIFTSLFFCSPHCSPSQLRPSRAPNLSLSLTTARRTLCMTTALFFVLHYFILSSYCMLVKTLLLCVYLYYVFFLFPFNLMLGGCCCFIVVAAISSQQGNAIKAAKLL